MKIELETQDIEGIAQRVSELLKPSLSNRERQDEKDIIFDVKELAEYLHIDSSWVYKQVSLKSIPFFKNGKYTRFRKRDIDRWIDSQSVSPIPSPKYLKKKDVTT